MYLNFLIALGCAAGGLSRFALSGIIASRFGDTFPWGTMAVNVLGSFVIGFFATLTGPDGRILVGGNTRQFVMTGFLGGFTTYSSFSLQTLSLAQEGEFISAGSNAVGTLVLCLFAVWLGHICAVYFNTIKGV
ncbi:MAG: fluoride efflux transporter CrcB [Opitutales bacterium]|jgi:CrcB protein